MRLNALEELIQYVKTKDRAYMCLETLNSLERSTFKRKKKDFPKELDKDLRFFLNNRVKNRDDIEKSKKALKEAKTLTLRVAFEPEENFVEKLYKWFRGRGLRGFLIEFVRDEGVSGGCELTYEGVFVDLTLKAKIKEFLKDKEYVSTQVL